MDWKAIIRRANDEVDQDMSRRFTEAYQRRFNILLNAQVSRASLIGNEIALEVVADALLMATGRVPNTDSLDVAKTGVEVDQKEFINTDQFLETSMPGVWALGDIVDKYLLKHSANREAAYAGNNILNPDNKVLVDYTAMPHAVFASPQVARVGITEQEAVETGVLYTAASYDYIDTAYGSSIEHRDGFVKVLADPRTGEILGCTSSAPTRPS